METPTQQFRRVVPKPLRPSVCRLLRHGVPLPNAIVLANILPALIAR